MIRFTDSERAPLLELALVAVLGLDDQGGVHFSEQVRCKADLFRAVDRAEVTPGVTHVQLEFPELGGDR